MADKAEVFDWTPFYQELADKLVPFHNRQNELISILESLRSKDLKVTSLDDRDETGRRFLLAEMDPFTFFGAFNRQITTATRIAILRELKAILGISATVPSDFSGIPVVNNQSAWFFSYTFRRKATDVPRLWDVFEAALRPEALQSNGFARAFDAALEVRGVNINLTMGLFWIRPFSFLSFDGNNCKYLSIKIPKEGLSFGFYRDTLERIKAEQEADFPHISHSAWVAANEAKVDAAPPVPPQVAPTENNEEEEHWLVGAYWDDQETPDQTERFLSERIWENRHKDKYLNQVQSMKVGDRIAIKALFAQKHDLPFETHGKTIWGMTIKATGTIVKNPGDGHVVEVDWDAPREPRNWYLYTTQRSIWRLRKDDKLAQRLIRFIFFDEPQDYQFFARSFLDQPTVPNAGTTPYSTADMLTEGVFLAKNEIEQALHRWKTKKNLILQGAPGVGKTFVAKKLAYTLIEEKDESRVVTVQFHPSFAYEDFVRGYRPTEQAAKFELVDGPLLETCKRADDDPDRKCSTDR